MPARLAGLHEVPRPVQDPAYQRGIIDEHERMVRRRLLLGNRMEHKSVIVTGGSKGLGRGIARVFAGEGAKVLIVARNPDAGEKTAKEIVDGVIRVVQTPSVNPKYPGVEYDEELGGESEANKIIAGLYEQTGCDMDIWAEEPSRNNVVGTIKGTGGGRSLIFNGHIDTVPQDDTRTGSSPIHSAAASRKTTSTAAAPATRRAASSHKPWRPRP